MQDVITAIADTALTKNSSTDVNTAIGINDL